MCGRVQIHLTWAELVALYNMEGWGLLDGIGLPLLNLAPTQWAPLLVAEEGQRALRAMRWGLPALWRPDPWKGAPLINAKAEEALDKATWAPLIRRQRCLLPTTGFYEWLAVGKKRYPLHFRPAQGRSLALGGVYQRFVRDGVTVDCFAVLTTRANGVVEGVHDRMPVIIAPEQMGDWLDPQSPGAVIRPLLEPSPEDWIEAVEVSTALNSWRASGPALLEADWARGSV